MAAFSRGLGGSLPKNSFRLLSTLRGAVLTPRHQYAPSHTSIRFLSSSLPRRSAAPIRARSAPSAPSYLASDPVLRRVIASREPVLLYKEPSRTKYLARTYGWALAATGVGLYSFYFAKVYVPVDTPFFVAPLYFFLGAAFVAIGTHIWLRPTLRVTTLELIPASRGGKIQVRIRGRKYPLFRETEVITDIWEPVMSEKTNPLREEIAEANRARSQNITEGLGSLGYVSMVIEFMARFLDQKTTSFFNNFKYFVLQFGLAMIEVDGVKWKLDCNGYLLEEGKALDRVISQE
ncbi:hypothetical protein P280DRAFT_467289 [Massarina eburnea CBS 473.64]|uniref:Uncharacterized protein n=1 Tax=Massarina eburnea CBS 473.64 TaxID=1395130 RepID=A0A6A6S906_9PLEO|nr:hypothetical protein P280DRAFT_467289 [Massarina eburnea CBS 473.64]